MASHTICITNKPEYIPELLQRKSGIPAGIPENPEFLPVILILRKLLLFSAGTESGKPNQGWKYLLQANSIFRGIIRVPFALNAHIFFLPSIVK